jgi:hypothetical protein
MSMNDPTRRRTIHFAAYVTGVVLLSTAAVWSGFEVGATLVRITNAAIIDGSGRAEPETAGDRAAATPLPAETDQASPRVTDLTAQRVIEPPTRVSSDDAEIDMSEFSQGGRGTYRTYCVRLCDGYYWPISFSATSDRLPHDDAVCQSACDSPARLFVHKMPRGGPATMVSLDGRPYAALKTAFLFRTRYDAQCRCRPQPWDEAATDRHRLFAAADAAQKGDSAAAAEATKLSAKIEAERTGAQAARDAANAQADHELASVAVTRKPEIQVAHRTTKPHLDTRSAMGLGMQPAAAEPSRGGFASASGSGRAWTARVFEGN